MAEPIVLAQDFAPYTDPGVTGQETLKNQSKSSVAPDDKAPGTPPSTGFSGDAGERAASLFNREEARENELRSRAENTNDRDEKLADA